MNESFTITIEDENISSITIEAMDVEGNVKYYSFLI